MSKSAVTPTGNELTFPADAIIVSKTDLKGKITYTNQLFEDLSGMSRDQLLGQPHNIIRHPDMPRCIFDLLWSTVSQQKELFAYVKNMGATGDHYWVLAHVIPSYDIMGNHIGYHSTRRCPKRSVLTQIEEFYRKLLEIEKSHSSPKAGLQASTDYLMNYLKERNTTYAEHIFSLNMAA